MSVINQMLKDLDARQGHAGAATLPGITLITPRHVIRQRRFSTAGRLLAGALLVLVAVKLVDEGPQQIGLAAPDGALGYRGWTPLALPEPKSHPRRATPVATAPAHDKPAQNMAPRKKHSVAELPPDPSPATRSSASPVVTVDSREATQDTTVALTASAALETVESSAPQPVRRQTPEQLAQYQFAQAQRALAERDWERAERLLRRALEALPGHHGARTQLASLLVSRQANDAAERLLAEGLDADPAALQLAKPYAQLLAARDALPAALDALARVPRDAESEALRAAILHRSGNHAEAAAAYETALQEQPDQALWWTGLAIAHEHNQRPRKALQAYRQADQLALDAPVRQYVTQRIQALETGEGR